MIVSSAVSLELDKGAILAQKSAGRVCTARVLPGLDRSDAIGSQPTRRASPIGLAVSPLEFRSLYWDDAVLTLCPHGWS